MQDERVIAGSTRGLALATAIVFAAMTGVLWLEFVAVRGPGHWVGDMGLADRAITAQGLHRLAVLLGSCGSVMTAMLLALVACDFAQAVLRAFLAMARDMERLTFELADVTLAIGEVTAAVEASSAMECCGGDAYPTADEMDLDLFDDLPFEVE